MRFDWYSATVQADVEEILPALLGDVSELRDVRPGRGMHGYHRGAEVVRGERKFATLMWGGNGGGVHVQASGYDAADTSQRLRDAFPKHSVTRADVCEDYTAPGAWDYLASLALAVADQEGIKVTQAGDWHRCKDGRTIYLGAPSSVLRARIYEKGRQIGGDPDHVRVELVARPKGDARESASWMLPREFFGGAAWTREIAWRLTGEEVKRMRMGTVYRDSDVERTRLALVRQYGPALLSWAAEVGGPAELGVELVERVNQHRQSQAKARSRQ